MICANCTCKLDWGQRRCLSSLLSPVDIFVDFWLCERCSKDEEHSIEEHGGNDLPDRVKYYEKNLQDYLRGSR